MSEDTFTRRRVLRGAAAGAVASGTAGATLASTSGTLGHVVKFEPGTSTDPARRRADSVRHELDFGHLGRAVAGEFTAAALEDLRSHPAVEYVEEDRVKYRPLGQTLPWGIDRIDADVAINNDETGDGVNVSIIDTGIDSDHPDLEDNVAGGRCFVGNCCGESLCLNDNLCRYPWDDDHGHGTHCAGVVGAIHNFEGVVGVAPDVNLWAAKVLDGCGSGSVSDVAAGIQWTADQGFEIGSLAIGATSGDTLLQDACRYAYDKGVLLVGAAGDDGPCSGCVNYPAAYDTVMAISATSCDDTLWAFSSTGPEIELAAPGENVYSTVPGGYEAKSGTSMACSHVSGAAAQVMADGPSNTETRQRLGETAEDIGLSENEQGAGLVDVAAALGLDSSDDGTGSDLYC